MKYQVLFSQKGITFPSGCGRYDILYEKKFKCALAYAVAHDSWSMMSEGLWTNWANNYLYIHVYIYIGMVSSWYVYRMFALKVEQTISPWLS